MDRFPPSEAELAAREASATEPPYDPRDEVRYPAWMERDPESDEVPE